MVMLAACGIASLPGTGPVDMTGEWRLQSGTVAGEPIPIVADAPITLRVAGSDVSGVSACNGYGGKLAVNGGAIRITDLMGTLMGCAGEVGESEAAYLQALPAVRRAERSGVTMGADR